MLVITADQVGSRSDVDRVAAMLGALAAEGDSFVLPPDRTAGDELQLMPGTGAAALGAVLLLTREGRFRVGLGVGDVERPLGASVRESTGPAFIAARTAVTRAKKRSTRFALECPVDAEGAADLEALIELLLVVRARRSPAGWELADLLAAGSTQAAAAAELGITPQAVSKRARAADLRLEPAVTGALARLIDALDRSCEGVAE